MTVKELILQEIAKHPKGMKGTELVTQVVATFYDNRNIGERIGHGEPMHTLYAMPELQEIIEIEYALHAMNWRIKSYFLPAGSTTEVIEAAKTKLLTEAKIVSIKGVPASE